MLRLLKKLFDFSLLSMLPDLDQYTIQNRPRRSVKVDKKRTSTGDVWQGKQWNTDWKSDTEVTTEHIGGSKPQTPTAVILDEYDQAFLTDVVGAGWVKNEARARVMKWHWIQERSAQKIEEYHTADGKLQNGYSERTAASYVKAFYDADNEREKDGKVRQRIAPTASPINTFNWE